MKLTKNFSKSEFECKDGSVMPEKVLANIKKVAYYLQIIRDHLNASITINSAYRSPKHNAKIGGAKNSQHILGNATDIVVAGYTPEEVFNIIETLVACGDLPEGGLHAYSNFTHFDIRGKKARW
jgi:uncharacterized protein YcbK (DUF882 family)